MSHPEVNPNRRSRKTRPRDRVLYLAAGLGLTFFTTGIAIGMLGDSHALFIAGVAVQALGAAVFFPVVVSFAYDRLREKWLGDEVWRLFGELADAGIARVYRDREYYEGRENGFSHLADTFISTHQGEVRLMGPTLKVFFNTASPMYSSIEQMLRHANGHVTVRALISREDSEAIHDRIAVEQPTLHSDEVSQTKRDCDSTLASAKTLKDQFKCSLDVRRFNQAPYCTAVLFKEMAFFSPNLLAPQVPVRLPLIVFKAGSHGYRMVEESFNWLWHHPETRTPERVAPASTPLPAAQEDAAEGHEP